jgi:murein DD-endopeptidase MepM/ murein hydrolase activator NlpD
MSILGVVVANQTEALGDLLANGLQAVFFIDHLEQINEPRMAKVPLILAQTRQQRVLHPASLHEDPRIAATRFIATQRAIFTRYPLVHYWVGPDIRKSLAGRLTPASLAWFALFEAERARQLANLGVRTVVGNLPSVLPVSDASQHWQALLPMFEAAQETQAVLGLQEFPFGWMWDAHSHLGYRTLYEKVLTPAGFDNLPLVLTAIGVQDPQGQAKGWRNLSNTWQAHNGADDPIPYWRETHPEQRSYAQYYAQQINWYAQQLQADPYVSAAFIHCFGANDFSETSFDLTGTQVLAQVDLVGATQSRSAKQYADTFSAKVLPSGEGVHASDQPSPQRNTPSHWVIAFQNLLDPSALASNGQLAGAWQIQNEQNPARSDESLRWEAPRLRLLRKAAVPPARQGEYPFQGDHCLVVVGAEPYWTRLQFTPNLSAGEYRLQMRCLARPENDPQTDGLALQVALTSGQQTPDWQVVPANLLFVSGLKFSVSGEGSAQNLTLHIRQATRVGNCRLFIEPLTVRRLGEDTSKSAPRFANSEIRPYEPFLRVVRLQNTGTQAWNANYRLKLLLGDAFGESKTHPLPPTAPGAVAELTIKFFAPASAGTYKSYWQVETPAGALQGPLVMIEVAVAAGGYNGAFEKDIPVPNNGNVAVNTNFSKSYVLRNTGAEIWENVELARVYDAAQANLPQLQGADKLAIPKTNPNGQFLANLPFKTPTTGGSFSQTWRLRRWLADGTFYWFGAPTTFTVKASAPVDTSKLKLTFVRHVTLPDGTSVLPNSSAQKTWRLRNDGTIAVPEGCKLVQTSGANLKPLSLPVPQATPGQEFNVGVQLNFATTNGTVNGTWRIKTALGQELGPELRYSLVIEPANTVREAELLPQTNVPDGTRFYPNAQFGKEWQIRNNSGRDWGDGYKLVLTGGNALGAPEVLALPPTPTGQVAVVSARMVAPSTVGNAQSQWQVLNPSGNNISGSIRFNVEVVADKGHRVRFVSDVTLPDKSRVLPNQKLVKTWRFVNAGNTTFANNFRFQQCFGPQFGGASQTVLGQSVAPSKNFDITVEVYAPNIPGTYRSFWRFADEQGVQFGGLYWLEVVVPNDIPTDGFWYPVGNRTNLDGWYDANPFLRQYEVTPNSGVFDYHPGADLNDRGGGDHDLGSPVYSTANGIVLFANFRKSWGNIVLIEHNLQNGVRVWSQYAHLQDFQVRVGQAVQRGERIGSVGKGDPDKPFVAHLHFEIRKTLLDAGSWNVKDKAVVAENYHDPLKFVRDNFYTPIPKVIPQMGLHCGAERDAAHWLVNNGKRGWCVDSVAIENAHTEIDYRPFANAGVKVLMRINYGYHWTGTIPNPDNASQTQTFIANALKTITRSPGAFGYIIANEANNPGEWPQGRRISPEEYAAVYNQIWRNRPAGAKLAPLATDPYYGPGSDNREWWVRMLTLIDGADFLTVHPKTQDSDPNQVNSDVKFGDPPLTWQFLHLRAYQPLLQAVPARFRHLPVIATEVNPQRIHHNGALGWRADTARDWINRAMEHFTNWNQGNDAMQVHGVVFYRLSGDEWRLNDKPEALDALKRLP